MAKVLEEAAKSNFGKMSDLSKQLLREVDDTLFNYSILSPVERNTMRKFFPFWTWHRNIAKSTIMLPERSPVRVALLSQLQNMTNDELDTSRPDWLKGAVHVGYADDGDAIFYSLRGANPYLDVFEISPNRIGASTNPLIKVAIEQVSGRDLFRERPFTDDTAYTAFNGKTYRWNPRKQDVEQVTVRPNLFMHLIRQTPQGSFLEDLAAELRGVTGLRQDVSTFIEPVPVLDSKGRQINFGQSFAQRKALSYLTGVNVMEVDLERIEGSISDKQKRARELFQRETRKQLADRLRREAE